MMTNRKRTFVCVVFTFLLIPDFAQDNSADLFTNSASDTTAADTTEAVPTAGGFSLKLSGNHEFDYHEPAYWANGDANYNSNIMTPALRNDLGVEVQDGNIKLISHIGFDATPTSADSQNPNSSWAASLTIKPYENYVSWSPGKYKFSVGYQIFSWGVADKRNPTDNLNPKDYTVGLNPDKIPVFAGDAIWYPTSNLSVESVYIPSKSPSQYLQNFAGAIESKTGLIAIPYDETNMEPKDFAAGGKISYNSSCLDLSLDYLYDLDQYYTPEITTAFSSAYGYIPNSITLDRRHTHRIGGDAKTTIGKFGLWLEAAYSITDNSGCDDYSVRKSTLDYTLGADVNYGPNDSYYVNIQYIGCWIPGYDKDFNTTTYATSGLYTSQSYAQEYYERSLVNSLGNETEGLLQGATCDLKWEFADGLLTPELTLVYTMPFLYDDTDETRYGALALNPEIDIKPVDSFHIKIGSNLQYAWIKLKGASGVSLDTTIDAIGTYTPYNNVYLKIVYKWDDESKR